MLRFPSALLVSGHGIFTSGGSNNSTMGAAGSSISSSTAAGAAMSPGSGGAAHEPSFEAASSESRIVPFQAGCLDCLALPTHWSSTDKSKHLDLSHANLRVSYKGAGRFDSDAAAVRANRPISPACGIYYFETSIVNKGRDGYIGIGVCFPTSSLSRLPGWDQHSFGYHGDDGFIFKGAGGGSAYGPTFTTGDVIGCCVNFHTNTVFYTKNGLRLGVAFRDFLKPNSTLYPTVGMRTPSEVVETNFGQRAFLFDLSSVLQEEHQVFLGSIVQRPLPAHSENLDVSLLTIVQEYLLHQGYACTAEQFANDTQHARSSSSSSASSSCSSQSAFGTRLSLAEQLASISERQRIRALVMQGDVMAASDILRAAYPECVVAGSDLDFQLKCNQFIELVQKGRMEDAIGFGQEHLTVFQDNPTYRSKLEDVFSLLAYPDPSSSPIAAMVSEGYRASLANLINGAVMAQLGLPPVSRLERLVAQALLVKREMIASNVSATAFSTFETLLAPPDDEADDDDFNNGEVALGKMHSFGSAPSESSGRRSRKLERASSNSAMDLMEL